MLETRSSELQVKKLSIPTTTHGKVLVRAAEHPSAVVVGFHGYMESATIQMDRLLTLPGSERWTLISVQGLHRFYKGRSQDVVAGWMTRQDREHMIADNIEYADRAIEAAAPVDVPLFTAGFSQGVAMAFRAGVRHRVDRGAHGNTDDESLRRAEEPVAVTGTRGGSADQLSQLEVLDV